MSLDTVEEDIRDGARARAKELRAEGESRAEEIVADAESDAEEILEEAEREVEQRIEQEREQTLSSAKLEAKQERLEARRAILQDVRARVEQSVAEIAGEKREELTRALLDATAGEFGGGATGGDAADAADGDLIDEVLDDVRSRVEETVADLDDEEHESLTRDLLDATVAEFQGDEAESDSGSEAGRGATSGTVGPIRVYGRAEDRDLLEEILADYDGYGFAGDHDCLGGVVVEAEGSRVRVNNTFDSVLEEVWEENLREISAQLFEER